MIDVLLVAAVAVAASLLSLRLLRFETSMVAQRGIPAALLFAVSFGRLLLLVPVMLFAVLWAGGAGLVLAGAAFLTTRVAGLWRTHGALRRHPS